MRHKYNGYIIIECSDGTFDIVDDSGSLIDGGFKTIDECKEYIDNSDDL